MFEIPAFVGVCVLVCCERRALNLLALVDLSLWVSGISEHKRNKRNKKTKRKKNSLLVQLITSGSTVQLFILTANERGV